MRMTKKANNNLTDAIVPLYPVEIYNSLYDYFSRLYSIVTSYFHVMVFS